MKNIYIAVAISFLLAVFLFIASFIYLDQSKHATYHYVITREGVDVGTVKVDRFATEDMMVYKSSSDTPFDEEYTGSSAKMELDRSYGLQSYTSQRRGIGAPEAYMLQNKKDGVSFLAKFQSCFACLDEVPVKKDTFVFKEDEVATYLPMIENYNFKKGRAQSFKGLCIFAPTLPPMRKFITLISIKDEYLRIGPRNIKTENLLVRIKNYPQAAIWVSKSDRSIIKIEIPASAIKITRTFRPPALESKKDDQVKGSYASKEVIFNNDKIKLAGTLTLPDGSGSFPAVLLIPTPGCGDRDYYGLYSSIAGYLSGKGFCVLRFDSRGTGKSDGNASLSAPSEYLEDLGVAIKWLKEQKEVDPAKISVISHSWGTYYAMKLSSGETAIRAAILLAPFLNAGCVGNYSVDELGAMASKYGWNEDYLKLAVKSAQETSDKAKNARHNWTYIMGNICFIRNLKEVISGNTLDEAKNVKIPVLIMQGKDEETALADTASLLDKTLADSGNQNHLLRYYSYLGRFLGKKTSDGAHRSHYEADKEVLDNMSSWLDFTR